MAIFFELLWLDAFYIGAYIPPSGSMCLLLVLAVHSLVNGGAEQYLLTTIAIAIPCSLSIIWVEQRFRQYNNHWYTGFLNFVSYYPEKKAGVQTGIERQPISFKRYLFYQVVITTGANLCLFWTMLIIASVSAQVLKNILQTFPSVESLTTGFSQYKVTATLLLGGFLGGCLSLRFKKAQFIFFALCIILGTGVYFLVP